MYPQSSNRSLILASASPYRKMLLQRLGLTFVTQAPEIDESIAPGESGGELAMRLASEKARAIAAKFPTALVIGSDQVAVCGDRVAGKPGSAARAARQLRRFSGRDVQFISAIEVTCADTGFRSGCAVVTEVGFRELSDGEIERYVALDNPVDCAGGFKSECAGVTLLRHMTSTDPTAIIGLPLIAVSAALREAGYQLP